MQIESPAISIIVPVYNVSQYLRECIESILAQTFKDFELILVNDGSVDNSGKICDVFSSRDSRIKVIHKKNGGVSSARNAGLEIAKGEWITFVDADDMLLATYLSGIYAPISNDEKIDFVHGGCMNYESGHISGINQKYNNFISDKPGYIFSKLRGLTVSKLFKRSILNTAPALRFDEKMRIAEDMAFTLDYILRVKKYAFVEENGYLYRRDNLASAVHSVKSANYEAELHSFRHLYHSTNTFINSHNLQHEDCSLRLKQRAEQLANLIKTIYRLYHTHTERQLRLTKDITPEQYSILKYLDSKKLPVIYYPFKSPYRGIYDFVFKIMVSLKALKR